MAFAQQMNKQSSTDKEKLQELEKEIEKITKEADQKVKEAETSAEKYKQESVKQQESLTYLDCEVEKARELWERAKKQLAPLNERILFLESQYKSGKK